MTTKPKKTDLWDFSDCESGAEVNQLLAERAAQVCARLQYLSPVDILEDDQSLKARGSNLYVYRDFDEERGPLAPRPVTTSMDAAAALARAVGLDPNTIVKFAHSKIVPPSEQLDDFATRMALSMCVEILKSKRKQHPREVYAARMEREEVDAMFSGEESADDQDDGTTEADNKS